MNYRKTQWRRSSLPGNTMIELLVVMIVAGVVFLMALEGAKVFRKYSLLLSRKLTAKTSLLYSHQTLELLIERSDNIQYENGAVIFHSTQNKAQRLVVDADGMVLIHQDTVVDRLFPQLLSMNCHLLNDSTDRVDSIFITVMSGKDTLRLNYGLSSSEFIKLNVFSE